ncbi:MAG: HYR domain-containing protein, partial [Saprospirales bacterium]
APEISCVSSVNQQVITPGDSSVFVNIPLATASDNCELEGIENNINSGGADASDEYSLGTTQVIFTASDTNGNSAVCTTEVVVVADSSVVAVCQDVLVEIGADGTAELSADSLDGGSFGGVGDLTFSVDGSTTLEFNCGDIGLETVTLLVEDDVDGVDSCVSNIEIEDNLAPVLDCESDFTAQLDSSGSASVSVSDLLVSASDNCGIDSTFLSETDFTCSDLEENSVTLTVLDESGNSASCISTVAIIDMEPPVISCPNDLTVEISFGDTVGFVNLPEANATDNCSVDSLHNDQNSGGADASGNYYLGVTEVVFLATDIAGNQAQCTTLIEVVEGSPDTLDYMIGGEVATIFGVNVNDVTMVMTGDVQSEEITDSNGFYSFEIPGSSDVTISPEKNENWLNGVSTLDLIKTQRHILNIESFDSPYLFIASDVNVDGVVSTLDLINTQQLILSIIDSISGNTSWRFIPESYDFDNPSNPLLEDFPEYKDYDDLSQNLADEDWVAVKTGDVTGAAGQSGTRELRGSYQLALNVDYGGGSGTVLSVEAGETKNIAGFQMEFHLQPEAMEYARLNLDQSRLPSFNSNNYSVDFERGIIRVIWYHPIGEYLTKEDKLFEINFGKSGPFLPDHVELKNRGELWYSEVYGKAGDGIYSIESVWESLPGEEGFTLYQNEPNPFSDHTVIPFFSTERSTGSLEVFDLEGRTVFQREIDVLKGENNYTLEYGNLPTGLLYYRLTINSKTETREMIRIR